MSDRECMNDLQHSYKVKWEFQIMFRKCITFISCLDQKIHILDLTENWSTIHFWNSVFWVICRVMLSCRIMLSYLPVRLACRILLILPQCRAEMQGVKPMASVTQLVRTQSMLSVSYPFPPFHAALVFSTVSFVLIIPAKRRPRLIVAL